jgi:hypothetical protein
MVNFVIANTAFGFQINVTVFEQFFKNKSMPVLSQYFVSIMFCTFSPGQKKKYQFFWLVKLKKLI